MPFRIYLKSAKIFLKCSQNSFSKLFPKFYDKKHDGQPDSLVPIMLKSADGWDQMAAIVTLTKRCKMEIAWKRQIAATTQHVMPGLAIPSCLPLATQQRKKKTIQADLLQRLMAATNT